MNKFILIVITLFLLACSKKNSPSPQVTVVGKWNIKGDTSRQYIGNTIASTYVIVGINSPYYQFNADGSGTEKDNIGLPDQVLNFTYSVSNNIIILNYPAQQTQPYAYQVSLNIQKLTASEMVLLWDDTSPGNGSSQYKEDIDLTR